MTGRGNRLPEGSSRPWLLSGVWLAGLGLLFFFSYTFTGRVTALRTKVPELAFGWEHRIPFLAWTIVPYWSTAFDRTSRLFEAVRNQTAVEPAEILFYAVTLFLCRTRAELRTLGMRLLAVQLLCCAVFDALAGFDLPFNQAPSLHIALLTVLWTAFSGPFHGWMLGLFRGWFLLMAISTLTTYQHHFIDLPAGLWVGLFAIVIVPDRMQTSRFGPSNDSRRYAIGIAYLGGALICGFLACHFGGAAWILLWPAGSLTVVAGIYYAGRAELFQKSDGLMPRPMIGLLAPYLAGAWLNSRWHTRDEKLVHEITGGVWLGRIPRRSELARSGVASVVDLTAELPFSRGNFIYRSVPLLDLLTPTVEQLKAAAIAIQELEAARPTLVCCALGYSRSAAAVAGWLLASGKVVSAEEAIAFIRACGRSVVMPPRYHSALALVAASKAAL